MYALVTLAATFIVATVSGLIVVIAPHLEQRDARRAAYGDADDRTRTGPPSNV